MSKSRPVIVARPGDGMPGEPMTDDERRTSFVRDGRWASWIRNDAGEVSDWHHHADNDTFVYIGRGSLTFEFGPGGAERIEARAGDFVIVPAGTIHRETTGSDADLEAFVIRAGGDPEHVSVDGPDG